MFPEITAMLWVLYAGIAVWVVVMVLLLLKVRINFKILSHVNLEFVQMVKEVHAVSKDQKNVNNHLYKMFNELKGKQEKLYQSTIATQQLMLRLVGKPAVFLTPIENTDTVKGPPKKQK